jgi:7-cyano-7-deazaguanine synthase
VTQLVILSGGLDSTSALALTLAGPDPHEDERVAAISFDYGQRHRRELHAAAGVAGHYGIGHRVVELHGLLHGSALLGEVEVPEGHYAAESMKATVVQGRNLLFASVAIASSTSPGDTLVVGVHAGDHPVYPDCRPDFWHHLAELGKAYGVDVVAPFVNLSKAEVVKIGSRLGAPLHLTWSCYQGGERHCGRCGTCVERAEAFQLAGVADPTDYADPAYWKTATA